MPKALLISWGINFSFGQMKMQNRRMYMFVEENRHQMRQSFGLQQMELSLIIIKARFRRMI